MNKEEQLSMGRSVKWVDFHMPSKTSEELWYLCSNILTELSERDSVRYRIRATDASLAAKLDLIDQGKGKHTKYAASSRNGAPKRRRGQGK